MDAKTRDIYLKLKIRKPVGKPSIPESKIRDAVRKVMEEDGMFPKKTEKSKNKHP